MQNETLTNVFWGLFLVWFGFMWAVLKGDFIATVNSPLFGLGTGLLMIALNVSRAFFKIRISPLTLSIGSIIFVIDFGSVFLGVSIPFLPLILIIAGILILVSSIRASRYYASLM